jgi:deferrochelatase/peroxidase EfeB
MKTGKKLIHLSNDLSFVGEVHIVVRIRDQDDAGARHAAPEGIGLGRTACSVVRNQSGFAVRLVGRKAVPQHRLLDHPSDSSSRR